MTTNDSQLVFGEITLAEAEQRFGIAAQPNPCLKLFGPDPMGRSCKWCQHLNRRGRYFKCAFRKETHGPGSDHRQKWPACGKYERKNK